MRIEARRIPPIDVTSILDWIAGVLLIAWALTYGLVGDW
jgi:hypothetical protein